MKPEAHSKMMELLATGSDDPLLKAEAAVEHISGYLGLEIEDNARLREFVAWVNSWVSNSVGSYSVAALDGLFGMTRDRIAALDRPPPAKRHTISGSDAADDDDI